MDHDTRERLAAELSGLRSRLPQTISVDPAARDPIVTATLAEMGLDPEALPATDDDGVQGLVHETEDDQNHRSLHVTEDLVSITWTIPEGDVVLEHARLARDNGWQKTITAERMRLPATVLNALHGRPVSDVVDVPGAEGCQITGHVDLSGLVRFWIETI